MPRRTAATPTPLTERHAGALLDAAAAALRDAGLFSPRLEAQLLLEHATGRTREMLLAHPEAAIQTQEANTFEALVERRLRGEPMAYLTGQREFYGHEFRTDARALIPRPETELLVELGLAAVARWRAAGVEPTVVEVGTGSGAVAVSLALACGARVVATEVSWDAITLARENAATLAARGIAFVQMDLVRGLGGPVHVLLANLPYVPRGRVLPRDVRDYEPDVAIFGGERGTELIEALLGQARALLAPGGELAVELDEEDQALPVAALARTLYRGALVSIERDAGGYDRVVRVIEARL